MQQVTVASTSRLPEDRREAEAGPTPGLHACLLAMPGQQLHMMTSLCIREPHTVEDCGGVRRHGLMIPAQVDGGEQGLESKQLRFRIVSLMMGHRMSDVVCVIDFSTCSFCP